MRQGVGPSGCTLSVAEGCLWMGGSAHLTGSDVDHLLRTYRGSKVIWRTISCRWFEVPWWISRCWSPTYTQVQSSWRNHRVPTHGDTAQVCPILECVSGRDRWREISLCRDRWVETGQNARVITSCPAQTGCTTFVWDWVWFRFRFRVPKLKYDLHVASHAYRFLCYWYSCREFASYLE